MEYSSDIYSTRDVFKWHLHVTPSDHLNLSPRVC